MSQSSKIHSNPVNQKSHSSDKLTPKLRFKEFDGDWNKVTLGNTAEIVGGGTPETGNEEYWDGNHQWFTPTELKSKYVSESKRTISDLGLKKSSAKLLPQGTLLFSSRATVGDVSIALREVCTNQGFQSFIVNKDNSNEFLYNWIIKNKSLFLRRASGSTFLEISKKEILKLNALFPSLPEQQKIASFLSSVDEKIQQLSKKKELLEDYKKGVMQQLFSQQLRFKDDDGEAYSDWEEKRLGDICNNVAYGMNAAATIYDGENKYLRITDIDESSNRLSPDKLTSPDGLLEDKFKVKEGDILFARTGASVGKSYLYSKTDGNLYFAGFLIRFHVQEGDSRFIYLQSQTSRYDKWIKVMSMRSGQPGINAEEYKSFKIDFPCLEEQQKIATYLSSIDTKIERVGQQIEKTQEFKKGLLQQMFV